MAFPNRFWRDRHIIVDILVWWLLSLFVAAATCHAKSVMNDCGDSSSYFYILYNTLLSNQKFIFTSSLIFLFLLVLQNQSPGGLPQKLFWKVCSKASSFIMLLAVGQQLYQKESLALVFFCEVSQITFAGFWRITCQRLLLYYAME